MALLALAVFTVTTGVAVARDSAGGDSGASGTGSWDHDGAGSGSPGIRWKPGGPRASSPDGPGSRGSIRFGAGHRDDQAQDDKGGVEHAGAGSDTGGGVVGATSSGAGAPPALVGAPAAVASGPAPDAAAAAPTAGGVTVAHVTAGGTTAAPGGAGPVPDVASVTPSAPLAAPGFGGAATLPGLGPLGPIGAVANQVGGAPAARALLGTGTGRSLGALGALLTAVGVFLAVHRRADRGDRRLAAARSGLEVARFR